MPSHWMILQEAHAAAQASPEWRGDETFLQFLRRGEIECKAEILHSAIGLRTLKKAGRVVSERPGPFKQEHLARLEPGFWRTATVDFATSTATVISSGGFTMVAKAEGILVSRADVERLWPTMPKPGETPKGKGGPKAKYDWPGAEVEMKHLASLGPNAPKNQAAMERLIKDWFGEKNLFPGDTEVRKHVGRFWKASRSVT